MKVLKLTPWVLFETSVDRPVPSTNKNRNG